MRDVAVVGAGMTKFGKFLDRSMKDIAAEAVRGALDSAGIDKSKLEVAVVGNATAGLITGQEMIRGQVALRDMGIGGIPIINTENACASSSTAFHVAWMYVASGMYDEPSPSAWRSSTTKTSDAPSRPSARPSMSNGCSRCRPR